MLPSSFNAARPNYDPSVVHFYSQYHGHNVDKLETVHAQLRGVVDPNNLRPCVFLAGDSSFDNKFWFQDTASAINGYEHILDPPSMKKDIAYWLNYEAHKQQKNWFCLNCAVEESALIDRKGSSKLLPQDEFIRDHIQPQDTLIVSVGGNDIALKITRETAQNVHDLMQPESLAWLDRARKGECGHENQDEQDCEECLGKRPPSVSYFIDLFKTQVELYVESLIKKQKPKRVVICMIYYPLESGSGSSWADGVLDQLRYNSTPQLLQLLIRSFFELATKRIKIEGSTTSMEVVPFPLFSILDGKHEADYVSRVEPSAAGGEKIGRALSSLVVMSETSDGVATS